MTHVTLTDELLLLLEQLTAHTGESTEVAISIALEQRLAALRANESAPLVNDQINVKQQAAEILAWLEKDVWSQLPEGVRGQAPSKEEQEKHLGF